MDNKEPQITGLMPAAGSATRLSNLPCSKEILPVGFSEKPGGQSLRVAAAYLLDSFDEAEVDQAYIITRKGKWDIPQYFGTGPHWNCPLAYIFTEPTAGTHHTLDLAYHFVKDGIVLLGFPDILFKPKNAFIRLLEKQQQSGADVVLGLFEANNPNSADMVDLNRDRRLRKIVIKPNKTNLKYTWVIAVWNSVFSNFLHEFVDGKAEKYAEKLGREVYIGDVIQHALEYGLAIETVLFPNGKYTDIGTISDFKKVWKHGF